MILQFQLPEDRLITQLNNLGVNDIRINTYPNYIASTGILNNRIVGATGATNRLGLEKLLNKVLSGSYAVG